MALVLFTKGAQLIMSRALNKSATGDLRLKLFKSNTTLTTATAIGDLTLADFTGYADITLTGASWGVTDAAPSVSSYALQTFTSTAGSQNQDVYGYVVTDAAGTTAIWGETFSDGPYNIANNGDKIEITPIFNLS